MSKERRLSTVVFRKCNDRARTPRNWEKKSQSEGHAKWEKDQGDSLVLGEVIQVCVCLCVCVSQRPWPSTATVLMPVKPLSAYPTPALLRSLAPWVEEGDVKCWSRFCCGSWLCPSCLSLAHVAEGSSYSLLASVHHESHQLRQEGHSWQETKVRVCVSVCLSHSFILSVLFVHLDVLIFKRKDLCWYL